MTIGEVKAAIRALPDDDWVASHESAENGAVFQNPTLKALADSHDELLAAAKSGFAELHILRTLKGIHTIACDELEAAIKAAEEAG